MIFIIVFVRFLFEDIQILGDALKKAYSCFKSVKVLTYIAYLFNFPCFSFEIELVIKYRNFINMFMKIEKNDT